MTHESIDSDTDRRAQPDVEARRWDCALIFGYGKSGTKRLLRVFDFSSKTHCHNEPYNLAGSPGQRLRTLPRGYIIRPEDETVMAAEWDSAVAWCSQRMGDRDNLPPPPKDHYYALARHFGASDLLASRTARRITGFFVPALRRDEWLLPRWVGNRAALTRALTVLKINQSPGFAVWVLQNRLRQKAVHIVRHPAAVLHSWTMRLLQLNKNDSVREDNINRLRFIAKADASWARRFHEPDEMSVEEAEMWFWCYVTETTHHAGKGLKAYHLVLDEQLLAEPIDVARAIYRECDLEWEAAVEKALLSNAREWRECVAPWRDLIAREQVEMIEKILDNSPLKEFWVEDQLVSNIEYG